MAPHRQRCEREAVSRLGGAGAAHLPARAGLGLKPQHVGQVVEQLPDIGFFEVHAENYMVEGGPFHYMLGRVRESYPLSLHGVGLSIGGEEPPDEAHIDRLAVLIDRYQPAVFSEHLAWSSHGGVFFNDLLPLPYDRPTLDRVCAHIDHVQERLGLRMLLENPSTYVEFASSSMTESEFLRAVVDRTGCGLLLDVNNAHVSCTNHGRDPLAYLLELPLHAVGQIHLAGFATETDSLGAALLIDNHASPVDRVVWKLYRQLIEQIGPWPSLLERDNDVPPFETLLEESLCAEAILQAFDSKSPEAAPRTLG